MRKKIVLIFFVLTQFACCFYLKYTSPQDAKQYSILEKRSNIEEYLNLFQGVRLDGIYTNENSGFIEVPKGQKSLFSPEAYLDFIHISDAHIRDERALLYSRFIGNLLDSIITQVKFRKDQEKYDYAVLKCLLLGLNTYVEDTKHHKPSFLIHTGDSVHVSLVSEIWEFLSIFSQSLKALPWFNAIGNHDITLFGTSILGRSSILRNPTIAFMPINHPSKEKEYNPANFINFHRCKEIILNGIPLRGPVKECTELEKLSPNTFDPHHTLYQGFDFVPSNYSQKKESESEIRQALKGYYTFDYLLEKNATSNSPLKKIRVLVLNTCEYVSPIAQGGVTDEQVEWAREMLEGLPDESTRVIAFGHHPLIAHIEGMRTDGIHRERLDTLNALFKDHVDVYFSGHTHQQGYDEKHGFLQVIAPSIMEFPQSGHKIRIEYHKDWMCIEVIPFSHKEMKYEDNLQKNLEAIVGIWESDEEVREAVQKIVNFWEENSYLKRKDINEILTFWKTDERARNLLQETIQKYHKDEEIMQSIRKAVLLKQAYLARRSSMRDKEREDYTTLGNNYRFYLPLKKEKH